MAKPPQKKPPKSARSKDDAGLDDYFDEFFRNNEPPPVEETTEPEQQRQWISDQLMWETTLGIREDETIKRVITPGDESNAPTANTLQSPPPKRPLSDQERQLLRTQVDEPAQSVKPSVDSKPPQKTPSSRAQKPQPARARTGGQKPTPAQQTTPRQGTQSPSKKPVTTVSKAPVKRVSQSRSHPNKVDAKPAPKPAQSPKPTPKSANATPKSRTQKAVPQRAEAGTPLRATPQAKPAAPKPTPPKQNPPPQTKPVTREADLSLEDQIDFDIDPEDIREKYFRIGKTVATTLSIAIVSFICGYYVGGSSGSEPPVAQTAESTVLAETEHVATKNTKPPAPKKPAPQKAKPKPAPAIATADTEIANDTPAGTATVFEGKEIDIEHFEQPANTEKTTESPPEPTASPSPNKALSASRDFESTEVQGTVNFLPAPLSDDTGVAETPATIPANEAVATDATPPPVDDNELKRLLDQSLQAFQNEKWQALIELSNNILAIDPTVTTALTNRAAAYTELGSFGDALADCNRAIKLEPKNPLAINNRGYVYEKMGDYQNATVDYEKACALGVEISCKEAQRLKSRKPEKL